jgi:non-canonical purine NTP pyrophosphatase (RdgB/HAM1 family)
MEDFVFVTGNVHKVHWLEVFLGKKVAHKKLDIPEIQSLDPRKVITHKTKTAYKLIKRPVLVEDTSLQFNALGKLPGPFIKFFLEELGNDGLCRLVAHQTDKTAVATVIFGYYDGTEMRFFEATKNGTIAQKPHGIMGHGWDPIFIPNGSTKTYGQMTQVEYESDDVSLRKNAVQQLKNFLASTH